MAALVVTSVTSVTSGERARTGALLVTATPAGNCEIDGKIRGPSPVVAMLSPGEHVVTCRTDVGAIPITRSAIARVQAGRATEVEIALSVPVATRGTP